MTRLTIVAVVCISLVGAAMIPAIAIASPKPSCCKQLSNCSQGIQKKSCCLSHTETTPPSNQCSALPLLNLPHHGPSLHLDVACGNKKSDDSDEPTDDDGSLYLRNETFLI